MNFRRFQTQTLLPLSAASARVAALGTAQEAALSLIWLGGLATVILLTLASIFGLEFGRLLSDFFSPLKDSWPQLLASAAPLWLSAIAFSVPLQSGFFNLGADGQTLLGGFVAAVIAISVPSVLLANILGITIVLLGCALAAAVTGAVWVLLAYLLKKKFGANEVIVTLLLNYIAASLINLMLVKVQNWGDMQAQGVQTRMLSANLRLPSLWGKGNFTLVVVVYLCILAVSHCFLWWTRAGLRIRATGRAPLAASLSGINVSTTTRSAVLIGGLSAGVVALNQIFGTGRFQAEHFIGWGFEGITVAILGRHKFLGMVLAALFLTLLRTFSSNIQASGISYGPFLVIQGVFIIVYLLKQRGKRI